MSIEIISERKLIREMDAAEIECYLEHHVKMGTTSNVRLLNSEYYDMTGKHLAPLHIMLWKFYKWITPDIEWENNQG